MGKDDGAEYEEACFEVRAVLVRLARDPCMRAGRDRPEIDILDKSPDWDGPRLTLNQESLGDI